MTIDPRVVFATNVLISAALSCRGTSRKVLDWVAERVIILSSEETLQMLVSRLREIADEDISSRLQSIGGVEWHWG